MKQVRNIARGPSPLWGEGAARAALQKVSSACQALAMRKGLSAGSKAREGAEMPPSCSPAKPPPQDAGTSSAGGSGWCSKPVCREAGLRMEKNKNNRKCYQLSDGNCSQSTPGVGSLPQPVGGMGDRRKRGHSRKSR